MKKTILYPGTFDPLTLGHLDIIHRATTLFDTVIIAVAKNKTKKPMFSLEQRLEMVQSVIENFPNVTVIPFEGLLVDLSEQVKSNIILRGIRNVSDFDYELQMGYANTSLKEELETIYLMPKLEHSFISSSVVRTLLAFNGKVSHLLPPEVYNLIKKIQL